MTAINDLSTLLASLRPELLDDSYVFVSFPNATYGDHSDLQPIASIAEKEGLTLVIPLDKAKAAGLAMDGVFRCISLTVHSSLEAVGLTAAFSKALAAKGISANVVAGYYHDHIFVPAQQADEAMLALRQLSSSHSV